MFSRGKLNKVPDIDFLVFPKLDYSTNNFPLAISSSEAYLQCLICIHFYYWRFERHAHCDGYAQCDVISSKNVGMPRVTMTYGVRHHMTT